VRGIVRIFPNLFRAPALIAPLTAMIDKLETAG